MCVIWFEFPFLSQGEVKTRGKIVQSLLRILFNSSRYRIGFTILPRVFYALVLADSYLAAVARKKAQILPSFGSLGVGPNSRMCASMAEEPCPPPNGNEFHLNFGVVAPEYLLDVNSVGHLGSFVSGVP